MNEILIPQVGEYAPYYEKYIKMVKDKNIFQLLMSQIEEVRSLYEQLGEEKSNLTYEPGKWTAKEVLGHMMDTDRVMAYRAMCISRGEVQQLPGFDQDEYVKNSKFNETSLTVILEEFEMTRYAMVAMFKNFPDDTYPNLGNANQTPVSVRGLIYIVAGHTIHHLGILKERYI
jgi:hypothetical protein